MRITDAVPAAALLALLAPPLATGCQGGSSSADAYALPTTSPHLDVVGRRGATPAIALRNPPPDAPRSLRCVGDSTRADEVGPHVQRVSLWRGDTEASLSGTRAPLFADGSAAPTTDESWTATASARAMSDGALVFSGDTVSLDVRPDGLVWRGDLVPPTGRAVAVTCWCEEQLFGNPWSGQNALLTAHYDVEAGCVDADGYHAVNRLPIEVVRETSFGECADLRGTRLNGSAYGQPQLYGWSLAGAVLDGARIDFADLVGADLRGADLGGFLLSYASISGTIDSRTVLPEGSACVTTDENGWQSVHCGE